jgi:MFS transporter, putative metabolite:H+ symporter
VNKAVVGAQANAVPDGVELSEELIIARIERLPLSAWHLRAVGLVGLASFFDAFDALTIAFVLPVLAVAWRIPPDAIGLLISAGYVGQLIGAVALPAVAERIGRLSALRFAVGILALLSFACALAGSYPVLLVLRFLQGIGLGGEVPIAATYINEACPARFRGRLVFLLEITFATGVMVTSLVALWLIPQFGWQSMFLVGGLPILLALWFPRLVPESARWLAGHGRLLEADKVVTNIEYAVTAGGRRSLPPLPPLVPVSRAVGATFAGLFAKGYAGRTITAWTIMLCTSLAGYGLIVWLPTIYRSVYHLPVSVTLQYSFYSGAVGVAAACAGTALIDVIGRRWTFAIGFVGCAVPLFILCALPVGAPVGQVVTLATVSVFFISILLAGVYAYVPEIYPTRMRALGAGVASCWLRIGSIIGPVLVGVLLTHAATRGVFLFFALAASAGALVVIVCLIETRGRVLEDIAH